MKFAGRIALAVGIIGFLTVHSGCKKDNPTPPNAVDVQIDLLTKSQWKATAVTLDGVPQTADYANFALTMTGTHGQDHVSFTTVGRPTLSAWPASGVLTFDATNPATALTRDDTPPVPITYSATESNLTMTFTFNGNGYTARIGNVKGVWNFTFSH